MQSGQGVAGAQTAAGGSDDRSQMLHYLQLALSQNDATRREAEQIFAQAEAGNPTQYYLILGNIIADAAVPMDVRQLAALNFKNGLEAKNEYIQEEKAKRWLSVDETSRSTIKTNLLTALEQGATKAARQAAQAMAAVAAIELPQRKFGSVILNLSKGIQGTSNPGVAVAAVTCLGFICSSLKQGGLGAEEISAILEAVVGIGMREGQPVELTVASLEAFELVVPFCESVFADGRQRQIVLGHLFKALEHSNMDVLRFAFIALNTIARLFYGNLGPHMADLFQYTSTAVAKCADRRVQVQALEFWNVISETEVDIEEGMQEGPNLKFTGMALDRLIGMVQFVLQCQNEDPADTSEQLSKMGGVLLRNMARLDGPTTLGKMMGFINQHFESAEWRQREAATLSLGALLSCLDSSVQPVVEGSVAGHTLAQVCQSALPTLLQRLIGPYTAPGMAQREPHPLVRNTSAWVIAVIAEAHFDVLRSLAGVSTPGGTPGASWAEFLQIVEGALQDEPHVVMHVCHIIHNVAHSTAQADTAQRNMLSGQYLKLFKAQLNVLASEGEDPELVSACGTCMVQMVEDAPETEAEALGQLLPVVYDKVDASLTVLKQAGGLPAQRMAASTQLMAYCSIMQALVGQLPTTTLLQPLPGGSVMAARLIEQLVRVASADAGAALEESLMVLLSIVEALEEQFEPFFAHTDSIIRKCLADPEQELQSIMALLLVGTLARACPLALAQKGLALQYVQLIARTLHVPTVPPKVKAAAAQALGELAVAMGPAFAEMASDAMQLLANFHAIPFPADDELQAETLMEMRSALFEAYIGILQAFYGDKPKAQVLASHLPGVVRFIQQMYQDSLAHELARETDVFKFVCSFILDIVAIFGADMPPRLGLTLRTPTGQPTWLTEVVQFSNKMEREEWAEEEGLPVSEFDSARNSDGEPLSTNGADLYKALGGQ